ncbi:sodium:solute symporter family protein [Fulvivirgaceae bacterium BMA10]|uniref:Sodium:solute symporter family protein n=1 Tax=Splendidivirga corallicola TaxID=3051826 RepID=A0ABT8KXX6_9BACT|nr:sodium:solute symporter family protein [Fulvivirgaceae bacterium BMA10]
MLGLALPDLIVLLLYFGVIVVIGIRASFNIKEEEDFFLGGRKFGKLVSTFASFGQATSADGPAGVATTTFNNGASGIWSSLLMLFATPLFWITSPWLRRLRIITMGDFYLERYGSKKMAAVYALVASIGMMGLLSVGYIAVTKTVMAATPKPDIALTVEEKKEKAFAEELYQLESRDFAALTQDEKSKLENLRKTKPRSIYSYINENVLIWSICILVLLYTALGGLEAAFYTDMLQGVFIILLSFILIPFALFNINQNFGGEGVLNAFTHLHEQLPENLFEIFGSPTVIDFTWYFIIVAAVVSIVTVVTQPNQLVTAGAAKDEYAARFGFVTGTFIKRLVTVMWGVLGLTAILLYQGTLTDSDLVWGHATRELLGPLNIGLVGLMLASMMAALMSTADTLMITVSGLIVKNLYQPFVKPKSEKHYLWAGRIAGGIYLIGAALITTQFDGILQILKFIWEFFVIFAAAFWLGLKWRKANASAAWTSILGTLASFYLIPVLLPIFAPSLRTNDYLLKQTDPSPIERVYTAKSMDVEARNLEIINWQQAKDQGKKTGEKPEIITLGQKIEKHFALPQKSIFWSKGIKTNQTGQAYGDGYLYLELILLDRIGFDLSRNDYTLNETIRLLIRLTFPFVVLILVALFTGQDHSERLKVFYNKMRIRVNPKGREADELDLQRGLSDTAATNDVLLFKNSSWEFYRWEYRDWFGFLVSWGIVIVIIAILYLVVNVGS